ncbi:MAG: 2-(1,2-epoxy-1,2-dihydrophenyl)acetyl-CoA isomerase [Gammaproteobacteria bacterium]|jgi:2-(1,2-epoxy-1,2-dihydrophenyl)acetyl-CoA isomerase
MQRQKIALDISDGLARITFVDPERHNTVDLAFTKQLSDAAIRCESDPTVKVVLLCSNGRVFSFGGDLNEFLANRDDIQPHVRRMTAYFHSALLTLKRMPAPLVVAVGGMAAGGGFSIACTADMTIAKRTAKFCSAYTRSGLTPDGGGTFFLPRLVGPQKAFDIMATNPVLSADEACALGVIARVVDDEKFDTEVESVITSLMALPSESLSRLKGLLHKSLDVSLEQQFENEAKSIAEIAATEATLQTLESFLKN